MLMALLENPTSEASTTLSSFRLSSGTCLGNFLPHSHSSPSSSHFLINLSTRGLPLFLIYARVRVLDVAWIYAYHYPSSQRDTMAAQAKVNMAYFPNWCVVFRAFRIAHPNLGPGAYTLLTISVRQLFLILTLSPG